ncbi:hypothetical protein [Sphingomonas sp. LH128]|uniref:hypothetical protein n=1 Tax=Sphingomonas sp. LH128 TaxID=473781 RepID=UPI0002DF37D5|nr:hypothetical protein [Sphingomonas sp. LH128]
MQVSRFTYVPQRFGIDAPRPEVDLTRGTIDLSGPTKSIGLHLEFPSGRRISRPGTLVSAFDGRRRAWRITSGGFDLVVRQKGGLEAEARLDHAKPYDLEDMSMFAHLRAAARGAQVMVEIDLGEERKELGIICSGNAEAEIAWVWFAHQLDALAALVRHAGAPMPVLSIATMRSAFPELKVLMAFGGVCLLRLDFEIEPGPDEKYDLMLAYATTRIADKVYAVVARWPIVRDETGDSSRQISIAPATITYAAVVAARSWDPQVLERAYRRERERLSGQHSVFEAGDLVELAYASGNTSSLKCALPR